MRVKKYGVDVAELSQKLGVTRAAIYARLKRGLPADTPKVQGRRKSDPNSVASKCVQHGVDRSAVYYNIKKGMSPEEAIQKAVEKKQSKNGGQCE